MAGSSDVASPLRFKILGPLQLCSGGIRLELGPYKQRVLLAALLCRANTVVSVDQLIDALWDGDQPRTARKNLQVYVSALRKIARGHIDHVPYGYSLRATVEESDLLKFDQLAAAGRQAQREGNAGGACALFGEAVRLWRDEPLVDLLGSAFVAHESQRLADRFLAVYEDWAELEVEAGRALGLLDRLGELAGRHPFRERVTALHMTALDQVGGRWQALACFENHRQFIARELGLDPSPVLRRLYREILAGESSAQQHPAAHVGGGRPTIRSRPAQLPRDLSDFVSRKDQVEELVGALTSDSRCTDVAAISGPTGVGKTALAVHVGHLVADRFADGQIFVSLSHPDGMAREWREVMTELLRGTGLDVTLPQAETSALALWRSWVAERQFLFVLDGATSEAQIRRLLPGRGESRTLLTASRKLSGLECVHRLELGEFSPAEALDLLERVLGKARVADASGALHRIREFYGLSPLVVRTLAGKLTVQRHLSLREYADQLGRLPAALDELRVGDVSVHDGYLRFHQSLTPPQQAAFGVLGALPRPAVDQAGLLAALGGPAESATRIVEELMEANVVVVDDDDEVMAHTVHYRMPALAYRYAAVLRGSSDTTPSDRSANHAGEHLVQ
ncbi:AfsR/SARP family transcriptional regulator [Streptomyces sp. SID3343]|uniref:AfsR/SARP family transcriptional regulator n=1 Tax=Streptomyces sp. SID3343 TaxID=2690260 RepID=UPI0013710A14|nr:AfsR/SARP family transcriptional regulator [Streptomyces sp. SID3343]MYV97592.1 AfsR family transcriptional regulator [Streptomyces sp. SID3343]